MKEIAPLTRTEAIQAIQRVLGNTEEGVWVADWTRELWASADEIYKRLPPDLAYKIINAHAPRYEEGNYATLTGEWA